MKKELDRSKASFKLDLIETANADPMVRPADFKVLAAYAAVLKWPSCKTWLTPTLAQAMTGLSERQFWNSRARLTGNNPEKRAYLIPTRKIENTATFLLINPWRDEALEQIEAMARYHREVARQKKAKERAALSLQNLQGHEEGCPCKFCSPVPANSAGNTPLMITPRKKESRGEDEKGAKVVNMADHRRRREAS